MTTILATAAAFAPAARSQRLVSAKLKGWQLTLTEYDPATGATTDSLISIDHSKGGCAAPLSAPGLEMDSAIATVVDGALFALGGVEHNPEHVRHLEHKHRAS